MERFRNKRRCHHQGFPQDEGGIVYGNYRGYIAGGDTLKIITRCLRDYCDRVETLPGEQSGFRPNRSTTDMMFMIR